MRLFKLAIALILLGVFIYYGHFSKLGEIPPVLKLLNPYTGFWQNAEGEKLKPRIFTGETKEEIQIGFDERLVPHIYAQSYEDALFAQGILHAYYRMWQMDLTSRAAVGKVSEAVGQRALKYDIKRRRLGLLSASQKLEEQLLKDDTLSNYLDQYINGINTYLSTLDQTDYPLEYKLMGFEPEAWSTSKTTAVIMALTYDLCFRHEDFKYFNSLKILGRDNFQKYLNDWQNNQVPIIQKAYQATPKLRLENEINTLHEVLPDLTLPDKDNGSNNWAIHPSRSKNNSTILANDPHLKLRLPSTWYEMHIHLPDRDIYGVSFPGTPGIVIGFNSNFSWGVTNVGQDIADWVILEKNGDRYQYRGKETTFTYEYDTIAIKDSKDTIIRTPISKLGRIVYPQKDSLSALAFQWGPHQPTSAGALKTFTGLNMGNNYNDFLKALQSFEYPAQNFVYADGKNIALHIQGKLPQRKTYSGHFPIKDDGYDIHNKFIPNSKLPFEKNPKRGTIGSANQHSTYPNYPYYYQGYFEEFRGRTLENFLAANDSFDIATVKEMQLSNYSIKAEEACPLLLALLDSNAYAKREKYIDNIQAWNYQYHADSKAATLFELWWNQFLSIANDEFDKQAQAVLEWKWLELLDSFPNDTLFDIQQTDLRENAQIIVTAALDSAIKKFEKLEDQTWGAYKQTQIMHMASLPGFSSEVLLNGGHGDALNAIKRNHGPSWRQIIEMGDSIKAIGVYPGGQSGNPGSRYYNSFIETWAKGQYYPLQLIPSIEDERIVNSWTITQKASIN